jgi:hypothetical protein
VVRAARLRQWTSIRYSGGCVCPCMNYECEKCGRRTEVRQESGQNGVRWLPCVARGFEAGISSFLRG